jgi:mono/diheme cytochrome c family protein
MMVRTLVIGGILVLLAATAHAADGAKVYAGQCAKCHGESGQSDTAAGKAMKAPALAGNAKVAGMSAADIAAAIKASAKHPAAVKQLGADDLDAAAAHVKTLAGGK